MKEDEINADYDEFIELYEEANANAAKAISGKAPEPVKKAEEPVETAEKPETAEPAEEIPARKRKTKEEALAEEVKELDDKPAAEVIQNEPPAEAPVRRTRKKREE